MGKNKKIMKNRDIEELVYQEERAQARVEAKRQQFVETIKVNTQEEKDIDKKTEKEVDKKMESYSKRKDTQYADEIKKESFQKVVSRIQNSKGR